MKTFEVKTTLYLTVEAETESAARVKAEEILNNLEPAEDNALVTAGYSTEDFSVEELT
jgi:hypothetical protein